MDDAKLTLLEHLAELRSRLGKTVLATLVLGGASLIWAREIFNLLMRPVLAALPEGNRALVYTSGIEEINVLLKVGLYAGLFLSMPVALYQLWMFVAPGLLKRERRAVGPFVAFGSIFFVAGALFCYFAILPSMFKFLLTPGASGPIREQIELARPKVEDATRLFFLDEAGRTVELLRAAEEALPAASGPVTSRVEALDQADRLGKLLDVAIARERDPEHRRSLARAVSLHEEAGALLARGAVEEASGRLAEAAAAAAAAFEGDAETFRRIWDAHARLAGAGARLGQEEWTRPMLSMREQLSLVLMLEIAFGAIFEMPLLMALLAMLGVLKFRFVSRYQRHAMMLCVVVAAIVSPTGDAVNLGLMALPMIVCFEIGVVLVWIFERRRGAQEAESGDASPLAG